MKCIYMLILTAFLFPSCFLVEGERIRGNGSLETENRSISDFSGIISLGSFEVYLITGPEYAVKVESDGNIIQYIETELDNGNLEISTADGYSLRPENEMKVYVTAPHFNLIKASGSGNFYGENEIISDNNLVLDISGSGNINVKAKANSVNANISGSGSITVSGRSTSFSSSIAGSGDIRAGDLKTEEVTAKIAGSGSTYVNVNRKLDVNIAGSGDVRYSGNPQVTSHIAGSGSVNKTD